MQELAINLPNNPRLRGMSHHLSPNFSYTESNENLEPVVTAKLTRSNRADDLILAQRTFWNKEQVTNMTAILKLLTLNIQCPSLVKVCTHQFGFCSQSSPVLTEQSLVQSSHFSCRTH